MKCIDTSARHPRRAQVTSYYDPLEYIIDIPDSPPEAPSRRKKENRKFKCRFCNYLATSASNKDKHERVHTKEKTMQCAYCDYATADSSNYNRHLRRKHNIHELDRNVPMSPDDSQECIRCPYCEQTSGNMESFEVHVRVKHNGG
ncbi:RE1-silencing transcription factor B-like [Galendromus occidentalis]|uniref:RE1-silencing transcription factor B-like n=1 Tax=Galendromus occidentalis TaxID=34638 RepID=A0AAJ7P9B4_9ACAR|nr:RE1-silencing transcription factor B-like [Galendromus occidentalis]